MFSKFTTPIKEFFGESNEFLASFEVAITERLTSPFYGYFLISWFLINWKLFYIAFFVNQENILEKTGLLRYEYVASFLPSFNSFNHWWNFLILPFILTVLFFWFFPYITRPFHRKYIRNKKVLKIIEFKETTQEKKEEKNLVAEEVELLKQELEKAKQKKIAATEDPEILWQQEYLGFKQTAYFQMFQSILDLVYNDRGYIRDPRGVSGIITYSHINELIAFMNDSKNQIQLTVKGMFFAKKYISERK